jgi:hypothetical protein
VKENKVHIPQFLVGAYYCKKLVVGMCVHVGALLLPLFFLNGRKIAKGSKTITLNNKQMTTNTSTNHDENEQDHGLLTQGGEGKGWGVII